MENNHTYIETAAKSVTKIIEDITILDITELSRDIYQEYTTGCEESNMQPRCKIEHLFTSYGSKIFMLLSQDTLRPRIFFTSKKGTTLAAQKKQRLSSED